MAVIGMGCLFPQAEDLARYWANIRDRKDAITDVPPTHWRAEDYFDPDPKAPDRTYARRGGFLSPVDFPLMDFGVAPHAIEATDTTQLLGLLAAQSALVDAGYPATRTFDRDRVSVVLGVTGALEMVVPLAARLGWPVWRRALDAAGVDPQVADAVVENIAASYLPWQENSFPGLLGNVAAGRIANRLDLKGSNCVVDAACASSLAAVNLAMLELAAGRCDMAVSGGVDTFNDIFMYMCFSKTPALSPTGDARPFAADADGTILGEGVGILVLKRLDDALRDGDRVRAIIRSMGSSSDGKGQAVYAPSAAGQAKALRRAYEQAGASPATIELVEAHGTGTKVGDAIELAALEEVYGRARDRRSWCALGSVKSQVGHTKAAAGAAGLIKAILALEHKVLPPSIKVTRPIESLAEGRSPFYLNGEPRPWLAAADHPRRAAVSAFGFGGSNYHCVLEEASPQGVGIDWDGDVQIVALSADRPGDLALALEPFERPATWEEFRVLAAGSRRRFSARHEYRLLWVAVRDRDQPAELAAQARLGLAELEGPPSPRLAAAPRVLWGSGRPKGRLAMLFPGQGSQYVGMLRELACRFPAMQDALALLNRLEGDDDPRLVDAIYPTRAHDDESLRAAEVVLRDTRVAQPAIGAISLGLLRVLEGFGVRPELAAGHSFGELSALLAAGRIDAAGFANLARRRGALMAGCAAVGGGAMLAVFASPERTGRLVGELGLDLVVANKNAPAQCVVSGSADEVERARAAFESRGVTARTVPVSAAFHSPRVAQAQAPFRQALEAVAIAAGTIPVHANSTAGPYPAAADQARDLLAGQLARPVEFIAQIEAMHDAGARVFLEVGPDSKLTGLVRSILENRDHLALAVDASRGTLGGLYDLARALATLAAVGYDVDLRRFDDVDVAPAAVRKPGLVVKVHGANQKPAEGAGTRPVLGRGDVSAAASRPSQVDRPTPRMSSVEPRNHDENDRIMNSSPEPYSNLANGTHENGEALPRAPLGNGVARLKLSPRLEPEPRPSPDPAGLLDQARRNLAALERMAERTADLHRLFLEGQEKTQLAFLKLLESQERLGSGSPPRHNEPARPDDVGESEIPPPLGRRQESRGLARPTLDDAVDRDGDDPRTPPASRSEPAPAVSSPPKATTERETLEWLLIEVVADKTGYPAQALELDQSLDADLGIDSIKRVEILSALQERAPGLPPFAPEQLGSIKTLRGILDCALGAESRPGAVVESKLSPAPDSSGREAITRAIKGAIADKTGYPAEMLELGMALDADLGIDSIKRVEIFSALEERLPGARRPDVETIAALGTLGAIVEFLSEGTSAKPKVSESQSPKLPPDLHRVVLETVAEKTGYPVEMLDLDMALDADLGIDSIKRVEILSAVQDRSPGCTAIESDQLAGLSTLREIIARLGGKPAGESGPRPCQTSAVVDREPAPAASVNGAASSGGSGLGVSVPRVVRLEPVRDGDRPITMDGVVWVADDGSTLPRALATAIRERGGRAALVALDHPPVDASVLAGLVIVAPERGSGDGFIEHAFQLIRASGPGLMQASERGRAALVTVTRLGGDFGLGGVSEGIDAASGALAGLAKTAALEWPRVACKAIDLEAGLETAIAARRIVDELVSNGPVEVGLTRGGRFGIELEAYEVRPGAHPLIERGEVVLLSGGARGVTAAAAVALAERFQPTLVLLGRGSLSAAEDPATIGRATEAELKRALHDQARTRLSPRELAEQARAILAEREIRGTLARIEAAGGRGVYHAVDVRDAGAVARSLERVRRDHGEPRGLIHGAGVIADRAIADQTLEQFQSVYKTKVAGLRNLLAAVDGRAIRFLALYSSTTARFGRVGQVAYAAANEALNKEAQAIASRQPWTRVVSFNWGPWAGGMVDAGLRRVFEREGLDLIPLEQGAGLVADLLETHPGGPVEMVVLAGSPPPARPTEVETHAATTAKLDARSTEIVGRREVSVELVPVLSSHVIDGHAVLPMALVLEWLAEGAVQRHPGLSLVGLDDLKLFKGVVLNDAQSVALETHLAPAEHSGGRLIVPVELRGLTSKGREYVHARARVVLGEGLKREPARLALDRSCDAPLDPDDVYRDVLFHGPELRGLERIDVLSAAGVLGFAAIAPAPARWLKRPMRSGWLTDPLAVDCAFQLMTVWCRERLGHNSLPTAVGAYRQFQARFPAEGVRVTALVTRSSDSLAVADIEFTTEAGDLVARIDGYECVFDASLKRAFRRNQLLGHGQGSAASTLSRVD